MPAVRQVSPVELDDPPPLRVQVGLGDDACGDRAALQRLPQEVELGLGELLGRVAHEQHPVGRVERAESDDAVGGVEAADAGGVDQAEAGAQHPAGEPHLDRPQPARRSRDCPSRRRTAAIASTGDRLGQRLAVLVGRIEIGGGAGGLGVADDRRHHRDLVRVHRADRRVQQRVDQSALAALELAHDGDADRALVDPLLRLVQRAGQVAAVPGGGQLAAPAQAVDRLVDELVLARHLGGLGDVGFGDRRGGCDRPGRAGRCGRTAPRAARRGVGAVAGDRGRPGGRRRRGRRPGSAAPAGVGGRRVGLRGAVADGARRCGTGCAPVGDGAGGAGWTAGRPAPSGRCAASGRWAAAPGGPVERWRGVGPVAAARVASTAESAARRPPTPGSSCRPRRRRRRPRC